MSLNLTIRLQKQQWMPYKWEFPQESHVGRKVPARRKLVLKEISNNSNNMSDHYTMRLKHKQDRPEVVGTIPWLWLLRHPSWSFLYLDSLKMYLRVFCISFFSLPCMSCWINLFYCIPLLICLFLLAFEDQCLDLNWGTGRDLPRSMLSEHI